MEAAFNETPKLTEAVVSAPDEPALSKAAAGGSSSSWMVKVCTVFAPSMELTAPLRVTWMVSSFSSRLSLSTVTEMDSVVSPTSKVRVPPARV